MFVIFVEKNIFSIMEFVFFWRLIQVNNFFS